MLYIRGFLDQMSIDCHLNPTSLIIVPQLEHLASLTVTTSLVLIMKYLKSIYMHGYFEFSGQEDTASIMVVT